MIFIRNLSLIILLLASLQTNAQKDSTISTKGSPSSTKHKKSDGDNGWYVKVVSVQAVMALGEFSASHLGGFGADFSMEHHKENQFLYFIVDAGVAYYLGKKVSVSGYPYKYPGYTFMHLMGGFYFIPGDLNIRLMAGPALSLYNSNTRFNFGGRLEINYIFKNDLLLGPVLNLMKQPGTNSLWSAGIKLSTKFWPK